MTEAKDSSSLPKILTRSSVLPGVNELDAGDVIECYALMRPAPLENTFPSSSANQRIEIQKTAIAFRYKPKSSSPDVNMKRTFELTLEYGPQRVGSDQSLESMPHLNGDIARGGDDSIYLSWVNNANIYYSLSIASEDWNNAYYMAPITGAVLTKILDDYIIDYPTQNPRYQPFTVVEKSTSTTILKSSNSDDFVWSVFRKLAEMYVAIEPVLTPTRYTVQFFVEDRTRDMEYLSIQNMIEVEEDDDNLSGLKKKLDGREDRVMKKQNVGHAAADFYLKFSACVEAIRTMDYSFYDKTMSPSSLPSSVPTISPSYSPTSQQTNTPSSMPTNVSTNRSTGDEKDKKETPKTRGHYGYDDDGEEKDEYYPGRAMKTKIQSTFHREDEKLDVLEETDDVYVEDQPTTPDEDDSIGDLVEELVEDANIAAEEAEKAAEAAFEAAESIEDTKAAEAATEAAKAAKKAAIATSSAAAQAAMEGLYGGDGKLMTSVTSTCFSDPKYGIRHDRTFQGSIDGVNFEYTSSTSNVFLYIDGAEYYRLNVTAPYWTVSTIEKPLPTTPPLPPGEGDLFDFALAIAIIGGFIFGMIVLFHNIGVLNWDKRLRLSWFFHPHGTDEHLDNIKPRNRIHAVSFFKRVQYQPAPIDDREEDTDDETYSDELEGKKSLFKSKGSNVSVELSTYEKENGSNIDRMRANLEGGGHERASSRGEVDFPNLKSSSRIAVPRG